MRPGLVRLFAVVGSVLLVLASVGWWLDTRVIDDDGFGDVVAQASQQPEMRDYIADQTTLRLARTSNFVSAARPVVTDAVAAAIATPPVEDAIREFAVRAHEQVFGARAARRVDIDAQQAATSVRSALQSINPALGEEAAGQRARRVGDHLAEPARRRPVPAERLDLAVDPHRRRSGSSCSCWRCAEPPTRCARCGPSA